MQAPTFWYSVDELVITVYWLKFSGAIIAAILAIVTIVAIRMDKRLTDLRQARDIENQQHLQQSEQRLQQSEQAAATFKQALEQSNEDGENQSRILDLIALMRLGRKEAFINLQKYLQSPFNDNIKAFTQRRLDTVIADYERLHLAELRKNQTDYERSYPEKAKTNRITAVNSLLARSTASEPMFRHLFKMKRT